MIRRHALRWLVIAVFGGGGMVAGAYLDTRDPKLLDALLPAASILILFGTLVAAFLTIPARRVR